MGFGNTLFNMFDVFKFKYEFLFNKKEKLTSKFTKVITFAFLIIVISILVYYII